MASMYACTIASPSPFAICGLPPERSFGAASVDGDFLALFGEFLDVLVLLGMVLVSFLVHAHESFRMRRLASKLELGIGRKDPAAETLHTSPNPCGARRARFGRPR